MAGSSVGKLGRIFELRQQGEWGPVQGMGAKGAASVSGIRALPIRQRKTMSCLGNVRFSGVPPGRIIIRTKGRLRAVEERTSVSEGQELRVVLRVP